MPKQIIIPLIWGERRPLCVTPPPLQSMFMTLMMTTTMTITKTLRTEDEIAKKIIHFVAVRF